MGFWKKVGKGLIAVAEAAEEVRRNETVVVPVVTTRGAAEDAGLLPRYGRARLHELQSGTVVEEEVRDCFGQLRYRRKRVI
jgi:hypothetical protein